MPAPESAPAPERAPAPEPAPDDLTAAKARNLRRDPHASLCVGMPAALPLLEDCCRSIAGEHPDWSEYRAAMVDQDRVALVLTLNAAAGRTR